MPPQKKFSDEQVETAIHNIVYENSTLNAEAKALDVTHGALRQRIIRIKKVSNMRELRLLVTKNNKTDSIKVPYTPAPQLSEPPAPSALSADPFPRSSTEEPLQKSPLDPPSSSRPPFDTTELEEEFKTLDDGPGFVASTPLEEIDHSLNSQMVSAMLKMVDKMPSRLPTYGEFIQWCRANRKSYEVCDSIVKNAEEKKRKHWRSTIVYTLEVLRMMQEDV